MKPLRRLLPLVLTAAILGGIAYTLLEPVSVFGYDGDALAESLEHELGQAGDSRCTEVGPDRWSCGLEADPGDGIDVVYELRSNDEGCWDAVLRPGETTAPTPPAPLASGCVNILDVVGRPEF